MHPAAVTAELVDFVDSNIKQNPGKTSLRFNMFEPKENLKVSLYSLDKSFLMNEDMAGFLLNNPDFEVNVGVVSA
jgi:DNA polymerase-3 subunit alpha